MQSHKHVQLSTVRKQKQKNEEQDRERNRGIEGSTEITAEYKANRCISTLSIASHLNKNIQPVNNKQCQIK